MRSLGGKILRPGFSPNRACWPTHAGAQQGRSEFVLLSPAICIPFTSLSALSPPSFLAALPDVGEKNDAGEREGGRGMDSFTRRTIFHTYSS